jgi:hypothetical protein
LVSGYRTEHVARQGCLLQLFNDGYAYIGDEVQNEMVVKKKQADQQAKDAMDLQKRYDKAMKMLG